LEREKLKAEVYSQAKKELEDNVNSQAEIRS